mmetsp:Transcript_162875/g.522221  ORF Transcript_162875/g.522221 Transcript_162875/m.522221 type:complete len:257 (+) Transcript_162875:579-1349(+)
MPRMWRRCRRTKSVSSSAGLASRRWQWQAHRPPRCPAVGPWTASSWSPVAPGTSWRGTPRSSGASRPRKRAGSRTPPGPFMASTPGRTPGKYFRRTRSAEPSARRTRSGAGRPTSCGSWCRRGGGSSSSATRTVSWKMCCGCFSSTAPHPRRTSTCLMGTSWTEAGTLWKFCCCCWRSSGTSPAACTSSGGTTRIRPLARRSDSRPKSTASSAWKAPEVGYSTCSPRNSSRSCPLGRWCRTSAGAFLRLCCMAEFP